MNLDKIIAVRTSKTVYRDGDTVVKVFDEDYRKTDVLNEALNQARVEETGLRIPKVLEVTKVDGKWAIVSEYIEGCLLYTSRFISTRSCAPPPRGRSRRRKRSRGAFKTTSRTSGTWCAATTAAAG